MSSLAVFIIGLLIGFGAEWIIDWLFWRRDGDDGGVLQGKLDTAESNVRDLEMKLQDALNRKPETIIQEVIKEVKVLVQKDRLQEIKGIGNVFAGRLNGASIFTFEDLAATSSERLNEIINPEDWQALETDVWVEQANMLAEKKAAKAQ